MAETAPALDLDLPGRLQYARITAETRQLIADFWPLLELHKQEFLDTFYNHVAAVPELAAKASHVSAEVFNGLLWDHLDYMFHNPFDEKHVAAAMRVSGKHVKNNLRPRWFIASYQLVLAGMHKVAVAEIEERDLLYKTIDALDCVIMLDVDLILAGYLDGIEKLKAEQDKEISHAVQVTGAALSRLAKGDLTCRIDEKFAGELGTIAENFNVAVRHVDEALRTVADVVQTLQTNATDISTSSEDLARRTEQQSAGLEEASAAMEQMTGSVRSTTEDVQKAGENASVARTSAEEGQRVVDTAVEAMSRIENSSRQISDITGVIDEIAFQTNLLALNAGVEAARAGDAGRGFAVVASEVRALAGRSRDAAQNIKQLIRDSGEHVALGVKQVGETGGALKGIVEEIERIDTVIARISGSARSQLASLQEINQSVSDMDRATQQNAAMVQESSSAMTNMVADTDRLSQLVRGFTISGS